MTHKIAIGQINSGLTTTVKPWNVDNDAFPILTNAYQWRGRVKRKRGTTPLTRLSKYFDSTNISRNPSGATTQTLGPNGAGNLLTGFVDLSVGGTQFPSVVLGSISITDSTGPQKYTDPAMDGNLKGSSGGTGKINYATGAFTITGGTGHTVTATFFYYPGLPVMDIEDLVLAAQIFPGNLEFDTKYSYNQQVISPFTAYDVSFYKNPPSGTINGAAYTAKTNPTPLTWNGANYQQFFSANYQNAMWVTNGTKIPFTLTGMGATNVGMQFAIPSSITFVSNSAPNGPSVWQFVIPAFTGLQKGDWVFVNEVTGTNSFTMNFQTGFVSNTPVTAGGNTTFQVTFPFANIPNQAFSNGMIQFLTNSNKPTLDPLRWYDGDPTAGSITTLAGGLGWVNFSPPISNASYAISNLPRAQYYLVGAIAIAAFKNRLLFFGAIVQSSTTGPFYLQDTVVFSQVGTPFYTASFTATSTASVVSAKTVFQPMLVSGPQAFPDSGTGAQTTQGAAPNSFFSDAVGFGGFTATGFAAPITSVAPNQDVLIVGQPDRQLKLVFTEDGATPFAFYVINSEMGTNSTFSTVVMDRGVMSIGPRGIIQTSQISVERIDIPILENVFNINLLNNGPERTTAQRDYINEWVYFTYTADNAAPFPNQTLFYNYRDASWAIFNETYTTYGQFRLQTQTGAAGLPWNQLDEIIWQDWDTEWGSDTAAFSTSHPLVAAGNQQGFIILRDTDTEEAPSLFIKEISGNTLTVPNHGLDSNDFIIITGALGMTQINSPEQASITNATQANPCVLTANNTFIGGQQILITGVQGMSQLNGNIYSILSATPTTITIDVDSRNFSAYIDEGTATTNLIWQVSILDSNTIFIYSAVEGLTPTGTYGGGGLITRLYVPQINSRQFPVAWDVSRKTRIGAQKYLFTKTTNAQVSVQLFLSTSNEVANQEPILPTTPDDTFNDALVYSQVVYTCVEGTNLGLTAANINLQQLFNSSGASSSSAIWHRLNTSLIGDTVQFGITLSELQMNDITLTNQFSEIEFHAAIIDVSPSQMLS